MKDAYYHARYKPDPARDIVWKEIVRFESRFIPQGATVVDLGAGYCDFINNVHAAKKYAIDSSPELRQYAEGDVTAIQRGEFVYTEIPDSSVDVVHASNFLEHFTDDDLEKIMREIKRILKPGGTIILMQPNYRLSYAHYFDDYTHKKAFSDVSLESFLVSHGFSIRLNMPRFLPFSMKSRSAFIPLALLRYVVRTYIHSPWKPSAGQMLMVATR